MAEPVTEYAETIRDVQQYYAGLLNHPESIELLPRIVHSYCTPEVNALGAESIGVRDMTAVKHNRGAFSQKKCNKHGRRSATVLSNRWLFSLIRVALRSTIQHPEWERYFDPTGITRGDGV